MAAQQQPQLSSAPAASGRSGDADPTSDDLIDAAGALLDAARDLVTDLDPEDSPRSAAAARRLMATCAGLFLDAQQGGD